MAGGRPSDEAAKADALALCEADYAGACTVALSASDVFLAIAQRGEASISAGTGGTLDIAKKRALSECTKAKGKCAISTTVNLTLKEAYRFDPFAQGKPYFTAQAWTKTRSVKWGNSVWTLSGAKDQEAAKKAVLASCQRESGEACEVASSSFNSKVVLYVDQNNDIRLSDMPRDRDHAAYIASKCAAAKVTCKFVKMIDSRVPGAERVEVR